jgi:hypothetical protein
MNKGILALVAAFILITPIVSGTCYQGCRICLPTDHCVYCPGHWGCTIDPSTNELIFEVVSSWGIDQNWGIYQNPPTASTFTLDTERTITAVSTYHWPGYTPGTIGLLSDSGTMYGPWEASGCPGQSGVANAYWIVNPNVKLPPGNYTIVDSGQATWSYTPDDCTGPRGHCFVFALKESPPDNQPPVAGLVSAVTDANTAIDIDVLAQCSDPDNDTLTVVFASAPSNGTAAVNTDGKITYTPAQDYCGQDSFDYTISDGQANATATVAVTVNCPPPVNHPPIAVDDSVAIDGVASLVIDVLANDYDQDGDTLSIVSASTPCHSNVTVNADGTITYALVQDYCGPESFTYTISDGQATATATVIVSISCLAESTKKIDSYIQGLADGAFKPPASEQKIAFTTKLNAIGEQIVNKNYQDAINLLQNDLRVRTDGYLGGDPEDDWITDSKAQEQVCGMIDELISKLQIQPQKPCAHLRPG